MSRLAREISPTGLYHIVFRGVNKQHIFEEEADYLKMNQILQELKADHCFKIETRETSPWFNMTKKVRPLLSQDLKGSEGTTLLQYDSTGVKTIQNQVYWSSK